jgi:hypothetical protein
MFAPGELQELQEKAAAAQKFWQSLNLTGHYRWRHQELDLVSSNAMAAFGSVALCGPINALNDPTHVPWQYHALRALSGFKGVVDVGLERGSFFLRDDPRKDIEDIGNVRLSLALSHTFLFWFTAHYFENPGQYHLRPNPDDFLHIVTALAREENLRDNEDEPPPKVIVGCEWQPQFGLGGFPSKEQLEAMGCLIADTMEDFLRLVLAPPR